MCKASAEGTLLPTILNEVGVENYQDIRTGAEVCKAVHNIVIVKLPPFVHCFLARFEHIIVEKQLRPGVFMVVRFAHYGHVDNLTLSSPILLILG